MVFDAPDVPFKGGNSAKVGLEVLLKVRKLLVFLITTKSTGIKRHHNESPFLYQGRTSFYAIISNSLFTPPKKNSRFESTWRYTPLLLEKEKHLTQRTGSPDSWLHYALELCDDSENAWHFGSGTGALFFGWWGTSTSMVVFGCYLEVDLFCSMAFLNQLIFREIWPTNPNFMHNFYHFAACLIPPKLVL